MSFNLWPFLLLLLVCSNSFVSAQESGIPDDSDGLRATILAQDEALFSAFNECRVESFVAFFRSDVEFYHDQTGVTHGIEPLARSLRENICGKVRRHLLPETVRVYRMKGIGALQTGVHRFRHPGRDDLEPEGEAQFIHLWEHRDGKWKVIRVISYDHRALPR